MVVDDPLSLMFPSVFIRLEGILKQCSVIMKLEGFNVTGSIKIKTAKFLITDLETRGLARPGVTTFVESSSGNLGVALSLVCRRRGYHFICVTDPNASKSSLRAMAAYGAEVVVIDEPDSNGGYLQSRIAYIESLVRTRPSYIWLNQYNSAANENAHYETTAREILAEFPHPDYLLVGTGSTGTLMGCARRFRESSPMTKIIAVEPKGSVSFGGSPAKRRIPGIGASRRPELLDESMVDGVVFVSEPETIQMCHEVAFEHGLIVGGSTGTVLAAARKLRSVIEPGATVITISADMGDKYLDTIYDRTWVLRNYGFDPQATSRPRERISDLEEGNP